MRPFAALRLRVTECLNSHSTAEDCYEDTEIMLVGVVAGYDHIANCLHRNADSNPTVEYHRHGNLFTTHGYFTANGYAAAYLKRHTDLASDPHTDAASHTDPSAIHRRAFCNRLYPQGKLVAGRDRPRN
jgi:hypothetical protein